VAAALLGRCPPFLLARVKADQWTEDWRQLFKDTYHFRKGLFTDERKNEMVIKLENNVFEATDIVLKGTVQHLHIRRSVFL
jgi:hypothetical protein